MTVGDLTVSNSTSSATPARGTLRKYGGNNTISSSYYGLYLGYQSGGNGTYSLSGGTNTIVAQLYLGYSSGSSGTYSLSGTGQFRGKPTANPVAPPLHTSHNLGRRPNTSPRPATRFAAASSTHFHSSANFLNAPPPAPVALQFSSFSFLPHQSSWLPPISSTPLKPV